MNAKQFLAEFGHIANAPGGIERLRELIYQFAVTGRLAPQQMEEGDASLVLERVAEVRQRLLREKRFKRSAKLESEHLAAPGIALPESWRWSRLLDLGEINPRNDAKDDDPATFVPMAAVSERHGGPLGGEVTRWDAISKGYTHFANGDVLIAKITPCFENGKAARVTGLQHGIGAGSTEFHVFRPITEDVNPAYVYLFLRSPLFRVKGQTRMTGTAGQKRLPTDYFALCAMPLPPKGEQARIVTKVDELMALCDRLEQHQQDRRKLQNALRQSTLQTLASAESPHELQESWRRLQANFGHLFREPGETGELDRCIKQLALKGLLTPADANEQIPSELLNLSSSASAVESSDQDWPLPSNWIWARCAWLGKARLGKMLDAAKNKGELRPYLRNINVRWHRFDFNDVLVMRVEERELERISVRRGDLVICEGGEPGRAAIWDRSDEFVIQKALHRFRCGPHVLPEYMLFCLEHDFFSGRLARYYTGATIKHLTGKALAEYAIPLPPINEQRRILQASRVLSSLVTGLRDQLSRSKRVAELFATTVVAALTGITIEQDEATAVKAPQTELIAPLRLGTLPDVKDQAPLATLLARHQGEMSARDLWQRFGGEIDAFYAQLKTEVAHGWITEPPVAEVRAKPVETAEA